MRAGKDGGDEEMRGESGMGKVLKRRERKKHHEGNKGRREMRGEGKGGGGREENNI